MVVLAASQPPRRHLLSARRLSAVRTAQPQSDDPIAARFPLPPLLSPRITLAEQLHDSRPLLSPHRPLHSRSSIPPSLVAPVVCTAPSGPLSSLSVWPALITLPSQSIPYPILPCPVRAGAHRRRPGQPCAQGRGPASPPSHDNGGRARSGSARPATLHYRSPTFAVRGDVNLSASLQRARSLRRLHSYPQIERPPVRPFAATRTRTHTHTHHSALACSLSSANPSPSKASHVHHHRPVYLKRHSLFLLPSPPPPAHACCRILCLLRPLHRVSASIYSVSLPSFPPHTHSAFSFNLSIVCFLFPSLSQMQWLPPRCTPCPQYP